MKWNISKFIFLSALSLAVFFGMVRYSNASEVFNYSSHTGTSQLNSIYFGGDSAIAFRLGQPLADVTLNGNINDIWTFTIAPSSTDIHTNGSPAWCIREYNDSGYTSENRDMFCIGTGSTGGPYFNEIFNHASGTLASQFPSVTNTDFHANKYYLTYFEPNGGTNEANTIEIDTDGNGTMQNCTEQFCGGGTYIGGLPSLCLGSNSSTDCQTSPPPSNNPMANLNWPIDGALTSDFQNWVTALNLASSTNTNGLVIIQYGQNSSSLAYTDSYGWTIVNNLNQLAVPKTRPLYGALGIITATTSALGADFNYAEWFAKLIYTF